MRYGEIYDLYQATVYDREIIVKSLFDVVFQFNPQDVLDCSCGTGLPALDFCEYGKVITCTDGSEEMTVQLNRNAQARNLPIRAGVAKWIELRNLYRNAFDFVMCRGNSIIYCDTWQEGPVEVPTREVLAQNISSIVSCLKSGGRLLIDIAAPSDGFTERSFPEKLIDGRRVSVYESVETTTSYRHWKQVVRVDDSSYHYSFKSAKFSPEALCDVLNSVGAKDVCQINLNGERPSYRVFLASW